MARQRLRAEHARPVADGLHKWLILHRSKVPDNSATAKAIEYSLGRWEALTRYIDDADLPIDNNWLENRIVQWPLKEPTGSSPIPAHRPARRRHYEPDTVGQAQRSLSVSLSQGRAGASTESASQSTGRAAAALLACSTGHASNSVTICGASSELA